MKFTKPLVRNSEHQETQNKLNKYYEEQRKKAEEEEAEKRLKKKLFRPENKQQKRIKEEMKLYEERMKKLAEDKKTSFKRDPLQQSIAEFKKQKIEGTVFTASIGEIIAMKMKERGENKEENNSSYSDSTSA